MIKSLSTAVDLLGAYHLWSANQIRGGNKALQNYLFALACGVTKTAALEDLDQCWRENLDSVYEQISSGQEPSNDADYFRAGLRALQMIRLLEIR